MEQLNEGDRALAVGCGLGIIEHHILQGTWYPNLCIHEVAAAAWKWISAEVPAKQRFLGLIPGCLPTNAKFDLVYLATIDYALDDRTLIPLLASIKTFLPDGTRPGRCLIILASFYEGSTSFRSQLSELLKTFKTAIASLLALFGATSQGQLWGWKRTREEYRALMRKAGYSDIQDGFISNSPGAAYWISGK